MINEFRSYRNPLLKLNYLPTFSPDYLLKTLYHYPPTQHLWVAYSGGLDSHVLLHALAQLHPFKHKLHAIHIHHGLHTQADTWAKHCQHICECMAIPCEVIPIHIPISPRKSIEACARDARYNAITQLLASGEIVLTAHHADDQAETVLLQLLRGAGVAGLAAMPHISPLGKGWLARPLLNYTRTQLHDYAKQVGLQWIEDNSNADTRFDRNFLRHEIIPRLYQRWPALSHVISRVANHQAQANELIHALAEEDWHTCVVDKQLYLPALSCLTPARQRNVLRLWLGKLNLPPPSAIHIQHILNDMLTARTDRQPLVRWRGGEVRRYHDRLFAMSNLPAVPGSLTLTWSLSSPLSLPLGQLAANTVQGRGLIVSPGTILQVRFRQGGERFFWRGHWRAVKKLLQDIHLLPWQRPFLPLIYQKNVLIAIPGIGICDNYTAKQEEIGWEIQWQKTR